MCTLALKYRAAINLTVFRTLTVFLAISCLTRAADAVEAPRPGSREALTRKFYEKEYKLMLRDERRLHDRSRNVEKVVSGAAALLIGVYGYYFDRRNIGRQLAYSATQTAGVFMISSSLLESGIPSVMLELDKRIRTSREISYSDYKQILVDVEQRRQVATYKQVAYSSAILATLYSVNAYQERERSVTLRNIYAFLGANFAVISGASFYKLSSVRSAGPSVAYGFLPTPYLTAEF